MKKEISVCVPKRQTSHGLWLYIHHSVRCVGRNFCGYLILRFFPNRKNSQNIVPANNSNNKVLSWKLDPHSCQSAEIVNMHGEAANDRMSMSMHHSAFQGYGHTIALTVLQNSPRPATAPRERSVLRYKHTNIARDNRNVCSITERPRNARPNNRCAPSLCKTRR